MYAGIDPGKKGAIVVINDDGLIVHQWVIPLRGDGEIDISGLCSMVFSLKGLGVEFVMLEEPNVMFGVNKSSMYKMGRAIGNLESSLMCNSTPFTLVRPKTWQKEIWTVQDIVHKEPKVSSLNAARRIFPDHQWVYGDNEINNGRRTKIHDGIIDASLLAEYCRRINTK